MLTIKVLGDYMGGKFARPRGAARKIVSLDPGDTGYRIASFPVYPEHVDKAVDAARQASAGWRRRSLSDRADHLRKFAAEVVNRRDEIRKLVATETGKPEWEAEREVAAVVSRVEIEIREGVRSVNPFKVGEVRWGVQGRCRYAPLGVAAVLGPAISPMHLVGGHLIPALLTGNCVVFKPSKLTPACGQMIARLFDEVELPRGVFNMVQGDAATGEALVEHPGVDAVLFSGSCRSGQRIQQTTLGHPHKLLALQMGGVSAAVVLQDADMDRAIYETVVGAFQTTGQDFAATGVVLVDRPIWTEFTGRFVDTVAKLKIGYAFDPDVFMGPLLSQAARERVLDLTNRIDGLDAKTLLEARPVKPGRPGYYVSPGVYAVAQTRPIEALRPEGLSFGPDVFLVPFSGDKDGLDAVNANSFPHSASVFTEDADRFERWVDELRYSQINHNLATNDMSMRLPSNGGGRCGNHRPTGAFAQRNCCVPVASLQALEPYEPERNLPNFPKL